MWFSQERYILCRHDGPLCSHGANKGRGVSHWRKEQAYERASGKGLSCPAGGSLCPSYSGSNKSPKAVYHHGPLRHATVIGCLKYGAGVCGVHVNNPSAEVFLKEGSLNAGPNDSAFLQSLRRSLKTSRGAYPPVVLAEIYREYKLPLTKIRRLHLMVVDLDRSRSVSTCVY